MKNLAKAGLLALSVLGFGAGAQAQEADFLRSLNGSFSGTGSVRVRADSKPLNVRCSFTSKATASALVLDGRCRGLVVVSRAISARLNAGGGRYSGTYVGANTGPAALSGSRAGNSINLSVRWAKNVNGDRQARLTVEKVGSDSLRLTTVDRDPKTGRSVVTSRIELRRS